MKDLEHPYLSTVVLIAVAFAIRLGLDPWLEERSPLLIFMATIVIVAARYGIAPGILAAALSLVLGTAVFIAPGDPFQLSIDQFANLGVFIVTSAAMLVFAGHLKASRERAERLQAQLQQTYTETAMGTMAATLAHELNQPLAAASNYLAASRRLAEDLEGAKKPAVLRALGETETQIRRTGDIIRHARDLVTSASAHRERASLRKLVSRVLRPLQASGTCENLKLRVEIEEEANGLFVNSIQIEQVLMNLLRNACQASRDGAAPEVVVAASAADDMCTVEVRDRGPGIPPERLETLFSAEGKSTHGGLGLGLSISRTIVRAHGGDVWAHNNPEGGASFFFTVPRATGRAAD